MMSKNIANKNLVCTTKTPEIKLNTILKKVKEINTFYIEIGLKYGGSFKYIMENSEVYGYGFDLFEDFNTNPSNTHNGDVAVMKEIDEKLSITVDRGRYSLFKGDSSKNVEKLLPEIDKAVVFIDGNHTFEGCKKDFDSILKKVKSGYIVFDDTGNYANYGPRRVVNYGVKNDFIEIVSDYNENREYGSGSPWVITKIK